MNKRIVTSYLSAIFAVTLFLMTALFVLMNLQKVDSIKEELSTHNQTVKAYVQENGMEDLEKIAKLTDPIRITLISREGEVLYDSHLKEEQDNHLNRKEVFKAMEEGFGTHVETSVATGERRVYFASLLDNRDILRSSLTTHGFLFGEKINRYVIGVLLIAILMAFYLARRLYQYIIEPMKEMTHATEQIAKGEYSKRVTIRKDTELKNLAMNFNYMAQRVEQIFAENEEKQNRLEAILKSMNSGVFAFDNEQKIILMNRFCRELFGIEEEVIGKDVYEVIELKELLFAMDADEDQIEIKIKKPEERDLRMKSAEIYGDKIFKVGTVVVLEDITDIKKLEKMRSQFVANVSHELKTPLTSIKGFSETLRFVKDEETRNKFLNIINEESERLTRLIDDILSLSAIEHTKVLKQEKIYMAREMEKIYSLFYTRAKERNIDLIFEEKEDIVIRGDRDQFKQLILNLTDNALKYTKDKGKVMMALKKEEDFAVITIRDTGVGIPKKHLDRIFERFYRVDKSRDRVMGGTGLGLAIVKHIVLSFGGDISVESQVQKGTTFTISLPLI